MTLLTLAAVVTIIASVTLIKSPPLWPFPGLHGIQLQPGMNQLSLHG